MAKKARRAAPAGMPDTAAPQQPMLHDCVIERSKKSGRVRIMAVPPEEWGIERQARTIESSNYCYHQPQKTEGEAIAEGYDPAQIKALPAFGLTTGIEALDRDTVSEHQSGSSSDVNTAARQIQFTEHYIRMDYEGDGKPRLYKVTTGGGEGDILRRKFPDETGYREDIEEMDAMPFAAMTPVIMTHRFFGRSIADLVMDIQRIKTALLRGVLDNIYLGNNPRVEVSEAHSGPDTLDDLLVARPGGVVRVKQPGGINWQEVPNVAANAFPAMEYMDATREWRTGVTRQGQGLDSQALQNQSATAVSQVYSMAQARIKLIARIFGETGIKDLFSLVHGLICKHGRDQQVETVQLRKQWVQIDPRSWKKRDDMTVHVGIGNGSKSEQIDHVTTVMGIQKEAAMGGPMSAILVDAQKFFNSAKQLCRLVGLKDVTQFFNDPSTIPPGAIPPPPPSPDQLKIQLEMAKTQKDVEADNAKTQNQMALLKQKHEADMDLAAFNARIKNEQHLMDMHERTSALRAQEAKDAGRITSDGVSAHAKALADVMHAGFTALADHISALHNTHAAATQAAIKEATKPKRRVLVRDEKGRATHADEIPMEAQ